MMCAYITLADWGFLQMHICSTEKLLINTRLIPIVPRRANCVTHATQSVVCISPALPIAYTFNSSLTYHDLTRLNPSFLCGENSDNKPGSGSDSVEETRLTFVAV